MTTYRMHAVAETADSASWHLTLTYGLMWVRAMYWAMLTQHATMLHNAAKRDTLLTPRRVMPVHLDARPISHDALLSAGRPTRNAHTAS